MPSDVTDHRPLLRQLTKIVESIRREYLAVTIAGTAVGIAFAAILFAVLAMKTSNRADVRVEQIQSNLEAQLEEVRKEQRLLLLKIDEHDKVNHE